MVRMNLNAFHRHGVFKQPGMIGLVAERLRDGEAIRKARVFPYQLLTTLQATGDQPPAIRQALAEALDTALANVPRLPGRVVVCPDVSGSMHWPVTGWRKGSSSATRCVDVAALVTAAVLRRNPDALVLPFEHRVVELRPSSESSVLENARRLAAVGGGGTDCSAPLPWLNRHAERADLVPMVSDNESWIDSGHSRATATLQEAGMAA
jgi:60 kDa SS-A/Ro ribonucleoprotein